MFYGSPITNATKSEQKTLPIGGYEVTSLPIPFLVPANAENLTANLPNICPLLQYVTIWVDYVFSIPFNDYVFSIPFNGLVSCNQYIKLLI